MRKRNLVVGTLLIAGVIFTTGCVGKFSHADIGNKMFSKYDANEDGYLNEKEYLDVALSRFDRADDNDDGTITKDELKDNRIAKMMPDFIDNYFKRNDLNSDNAVSKDEIINQRKKDFVSSDTDGNSKLTKDEMKDFRMQKRFNRIDIDEDGMISKDEYKKQNIPFHR